MSKVQSKLSYIVSGQGRIAAVANGQPYTVSPDHPNYKKIKESLKTGDADTFIKLADIPKTIEAASAKVKVVNGVVFYGNRELHTTLAKRITWMLSEGFEIKPLIAFLENLMLNPSKRAIEELYTWMEHQDVPITEDGCWIGYKYLYDSGHAKGEGKTPLPNEPKDQDILVDVHSGTVRQWLGKVVEMERNEVDDNWGVDCSEGLHVGSSNYNFSGNVRVMVKVNPKDVVAVPGTESHKCRVCRYEIVKIFDKVYTAPVVDAYGDDLPSSKVVVDEEESDECEYCGDQFCYGECLDEVD